MAELPWLLLKRLVGILPVTPHDVQEGQIRYDRSGAVDGKFYLAQQVAAGTRRWLDLTAGGSGPAPANATYIVQTADATLTSEQALGALGTGMVKNTTTTGVLSIGTPGTDYTSPSGTENLQNKTLDATNSLTIKDANLIVQDNADTTKEAVLELSGITTGTTRILTVPNKSGTLAMTNDKLSAFAATTSAELAGVVSDETGTGSLVFATRPLIDLQDSITAFQDNGDNTKQMKFDISGVTTGTTRTLTVPNASGGLTLIDTGWQTPPGPGILGTTNVTALVTQQCGARYLGMVPFDVSSVEVNVAVTTAAVTITWAEVALASANSATGGNMTLLGTVTDVSTTFNSTGVKTVTFSINVPAGTFLYFLFGSQATTPFQLRATLADELAIGVHRLASTTRPSTMAAPTAFATSTAITGAAWCPFRWS